MSAHATVTVYIPDRADEAPELTYADVMMNVTSTVPRETLATLLLALAEQLFIREVASTFADADPFSTPTDLQEQITLTSARLRTIDELVHLPMDRVDWSLNTE